MDNFNYKKYLKNNPLLSEEKKVGKLDWKFMSDDERMDALLSVVKDPDEAGKYIELDWEDLPARINPQNMRIFEKSGIVNEAAETQFTKPGKDGQPAKDGDIYFSKREGNAIAVKRGDTLQSVYVYDGQPKLGKIHKTDKRWENMGPLSRGLLTDLTAKGVGGLYTIEVAAEDAKILLQFLSDMTESVNEGSLDSIFGGIPYKTVGTKSFTTAYIPDDVKTRIIVRAKEAGKIAKPNASGGVTVFE